MRSNRAVKIGLVVTFIGASGLAFAQDDAPVAQPQFSAQDEAGPQGAGPQDPGPRSAGPQSQNNVGWRRLGDNRERDRDDRDGRYAQRGPAPALNLPPQLTIAPGTFILVRMNQALSSDRNQTGDAFSATLVKPLVVNGVVVADRGEVVQGRVSEAEKAGRVKGVSRLGIELTDLTLIDGNQ